ncbi:SETMR methyltransferase, partial [Acromyrmex charruanus]
MEQRVVIKFNAKLGKSASETFRSMQQVYGSQCLGRTAVFEWHKRFLEGRETFEDDKKSGQPILIRTPKIIEKVRDFVANDRNASLKMMEEALNISREMIRTILHEDSGKTKVCAKFVPVSVLNHPPYSPDLAPCDFSLFPKLKLKLKGRFFDDIPTIQSASTQALEAIPQTELEHAFESLLNRCNKCIEARGEYFE